MKGPFITLRSLAAASVVLALASAARDNGVVVGSIGEYLREQRRNAEMSLRQLAERAGVSNPYLSQIERGVRRPSAEVLSQLAKALQVSAEAMYVRAGLLDPDDGAGAADHAEERAVEKAIRADSVLTERHKRALLDIYASFRREAEQVSRTHDESPTRRTENVPPEP